MQVGSSGPQDQSVESGEPKASFGINTPFLVALVRLSELKLHSLFEVERTKETSGSFWRDVVELTMLDAAAVTGVADTVANVDGD